MDFIVVNSVPYDYQYIRKYIVVPITSSKYLLNKILFFRLYIMNEILRNFFNSKINFIRI